MGRIIKIDNAIHILFLDLDEYLINRATGDRVNKLVESHPGADAFSFLWYLEHWNQNKKKFSDPVSNNTAGIRNNHVKSLIKISRKIKSCSHHNAQFKDGYIPVNLLSDTKIRLVDGENSSLNRALVSNDIVKRLSKETIEGWSVLHCVYRSETEYLASLIRARALNNHTDPIKNNRWGLINPDGQILNLKNAKGSLSYKFKLFLFMTRHKLHQELRVARNNLIQRREKLDLLLKNRPEILTKYSKVFRGTIYDNELNKS